MQTKKVIFPEFGRIPFTSMYGPVNTPMTMDIPTLVNIVNTKTKVIECILNHNTGEYIGKVELNVDNVNKNNYHTFLAGEKEKEQNKAEAPETTKEPEQKQAENNSNGFKEEAPKSDDEGKKEQNDADKEKEKNQQNQGGNNNSGKNNNNRNNKNK